MSCGQLNNYIAWWSEKHNCFIAHDNKIEESRVEAWTDIPNNENWKITGQSSLLWEENKL